MGKAKQNLLVDNGSLNTLAQTGTSASDKDYSDKSIVLIGKGSCKASIQKRFKKKFITQKTILALVDIAKEEKDKEWEQRYWNTYHCQNVIYTHEGRGYGRFCKNRFCAVCLAIRKADMINRYKPIIDEWDDVHFLTLTIKSVKKDKLDLYFDLMLKAFGKIRARCAKRHQRGKGPKLIGIRSLEANYNAAKEWYNPHFHILVASEEIAETIKNEWLEIWNRKRQLAVEYAQDIRPVSNTEKDIIETIKYGAKVISDSDPSRKKKGKNKDKRIYAAALHEIYKAMDGHRLFGSFGFTLPKSQHTPQYKEVVEFKEWIYESRLMTYIDEGTGEIMKNYIPDSTLEYIVNHIDVDSN